MDLQLHPDLLQRLRRELYRAGGREIGGVLVGEHLGPRLFRVVDLSVQRSGGTDSCFVRRPEEHKRFLDSFFARTGEKYERFNYLGEWHSHPNFKVTPSEVDVRQMRSIVCDGPTAPLFAVLLIVRLGAGRAIETSANIFGRGCPEENCRLLVVDRPMNDPARSPKSWWERLFEPSSRPRRFI